MVLSMIYDDFVKKVNDLNGKDCFTRSNEKNNPYNDFYNHYNPMGAEFDFNYGTVFMIPFNMISKVTLEYKYTKADFVFGISNGDPYFVKGKKVYTCCHGTKEPDLELVANSFEDFLEKVVKGSN